MPTALKWSEVVRIEMLCEGIYGIELGKDNAFRVVTGIHNKICFFLRIEVGVRNMYTITTRGIDSIVMNFLYFLDLEETLNSSSNFHKL